MDGDHKEITCTTKRPLLASSLTTLKLQVSSASSTYFVAHYFLLKASLFHYSHSSVSFPLLFIYGLPLSVFTAVHF
jgi:hypothetical protein